MRSQTLILLTALILVSGLAQAKPIKVQVKGMVCAFCAQGIEKKFKALEETSKVKVSLETKIVDVETKENKDISDDRIKKIITDAGYDVVKIERPK